MAQPIVMPDLGSGMEEGTLLNWTKKVGDSIADGDVIAEIETDKTTVEVPVSAVGTITQLIGDVGATLKVGAVIGYVGEAGAVAEPAAVTQNEGGAKSPATNAAVTEAAKQAPQPPAAASAPPAPVAEDGNLPGGVKATPIARNIAADKGIDLKLVVGTGPGGRITKSDVENFNPSAAPATAPAAPSQASAPAAIAAPNYGTVPSGADVEIIETTKMRTRIASRMVESKQQIPHFYLTSEINVEPLMALRKQINEGLAEDAKVSVNDLIVKATALTLRQFPNLNTHFYGDKLVRHKRINIGIAVALSNGGLMNVVAKDADKVSIGTLAAHNKAMIARARDNKVKPDDIQGSTFTVSNLGSFDVEVFQAIVNPPEAGILAVGSAKKVPIVLADGSLGVGMRMKITISVDHRVSDGAEGAQFLQALKKLIENPMGLLL
jgi:pyruvate dehydrogenase E2 component (dihydrolipoamide acetyltransferase)